MKMTSEQVKDLLCERLRHEERSFSYDSKKDELRIINERTKKGITVSIPSIVSKTENGLENAIDETVYYIREALEAMGSSMDVTDIGSKVYPVIRSTSFPIKSQDGSPFITDEHTAETRIYYAVDLGNTYRLLDEKAVRETGMDIQLIRKLAHKNLLGLSTNMSSDQVAGNIFYFVATKDGYDASKILNEQWLNEMSGKVEGEMAIAVPHGDVCIIADIRNNTGYDVLAQMAMSFFANGHVPITALSFLYEAGKLEPIFILGKNKKRT
ncbi:MAG: DUF1444 domain-containing protein [Bacillus sp. (in: firmicutes)]